MDETQVRQLIKQEIQAAQAANRFQLTPIQRHTHNNIDSPFVFNPIISYVGIIQTCSTVITLPKGWQFARLGTGSVQIAHNLYPRGTNTTQNTTNSPLVFVASTFGAGGATLPVSIITTGISTVTFPQANGIVEFDWFDANGAAAPVDATFSFICVQANNKSTTPPQYTTN